VPRPGSARGPRRVLAALAATALLVVGVGGVAVAAADPQLRTSEPTSVTGTAGTAVFTIGVHHVRHVRYEDRGTLRYTFRLHNDGVLPVTVTGLAEEQPRSRLLQPRSVGGPGGEDDVVVPARGDAAVTLSLFMSGCETLSARAGSLLTEVVLRTEQAGMIEDEVTVTLPEELRTGSPREAFCPGATATSRPNG
jgi:hypothetical protein